MINFPKSCKMKRHSILLLVVVLLNACNKEPAGRINRHELVSRHNVIIKSVDSLNSLTVGNGDFAYTVDITGLQTFPGYYVKGIPLGTFSNWCWHAYPNTSGYSNDQVVKYFRVGGREVGYYHDYSREGNTERARASSYLRQNPHRLNMGMLGLRILDENGNRISKEDIGNPDQVLDLWKGEIRSNFEVDGIAVSVITLCHPERDMIAVQVSSDLLKEGRLALELRFPEADPGWKNVALWGDPDQHESKIINTDEEGTLLEHSQDSTLYLVNLKYSAGTVEKTAAHTYTLITGEGNETISLTCEYLDPPGEISGDNDFGSVKVMAEQAWKEFWESGGAVDFSGCSDPRAPELERRVVLSRYLAQVQCSGSLPPQETGLTYNSWYGKFHLEMHWWHAVHFALWNRPDVLEKQMEYYEQVRAPAEELAQFQGYAGARWPKMTDPRGITSPRTVGNYLIWEQPHYIYFAELLYSIASDKPPILNKYSDLVFETADFMASYPVYDTIRDRYVLGPALIPAQETFSAATTINPSFELTYWYWALNRAIDWKTRMEQPVPDLWRTVVARLSDLPVQDSLYLFTEDGTDSYTNERYISDHPMVLGCLGVLPETDKVNRDIMQNTYEKVVERWNWPSTWGWDFPMVAMAAAELGRSEDAIKFLLLDVQKNTYLPNGHNYQDGRLTLYMPGNGGLLTAIARMCTKDQFPKDGNWNVAWENLNDF